MKIATISNCLKALENEHQRAPELSFMRLDVNRKSPHHVTLNDIRIALTNSAQHWTLTVPRGANFRASRWRIEARAAESARYPLLATARYISSALTLLNSTGDSYTRPALLEDAFTPLEEFIRLNGTPERRSLFRAGIESISHAIATLRIEHLHHGELTRQNIAFTPEGDLRLTGYPITNGKGVDAERLGEAALLLFVAGCDPDAYQFLITTNRDEAERKRRLRCLLVSAEYYAVDAMAQLVRLIMQGGSSHSFEQAVATLASQPFRAIPTLNILLRASSKAIATPPDTQLCDDEVYARIDLSLCDEVTSPTDQIVRYRRGNYWGYAYTDGERINVERRLTSAGEFSEGRAVIGTERGYGLMDSTGRLVMNDVWASLAWYPDENVVVASDNKGFWQIYNRMGHQLSAYPADWMGDASEGFVVARRENKYCYYSTDGRKLSDYIYDDAQPFLNGQALVCFRGRYYHIDTTLHQVANRIKKEEK